ncbi:MAG: hypothetical protein WCH39_06215 [Schlesneria sp.]
MILFILSLVGLLTLLVLVFDFLNPVICESLLCEVWLEWCERRVGFGTVIAFLAIAAAAYVSGHLCFGG